MMNDFVMYMLGFYGKDGIYDINATTEEILLATGIRLERFKEISFCGDTFDREKIRDIILEVREKTWAI